MRLRTAIHAVLRCSSEHFKSFESPFIQRSEIFEETYCNQVWTNAEISVASARLTSRCKESSVSVPLRRSCDFQVTRRVPGRSVNAAGSKEAGRIDDGGGIARTRESGQ